MLTRQLTYLCVWKASFALVLLLSASLVGAQVPTLADYFRESELRDIAISPDGRKLAIIKRIEEGAYELQTYDVENEFELIVAIEEPTGKQLSGVQWLSNNRLGVTLSSSAYRWMLAMDADGARCA